MSCNWLLILCVNAVFRGQKKIWGEGGNGIQLGSGVCRLHLALCINVGEIVLALSQYCVCSLERGTSWILRPRAASPACASPKHAF